ESLLPRFALSGFALAALELLLVIASGRDLFLSVTELGRYALLACTSLPALCALLGVLVELVLRAVARFGPANAAGRARVLRVLALAVGAPSLSWVFWSLTSGRRVRALPGRPLFVALLALGACFGISLVARQVARVHERAHGGRFALLGFLTVALIAL